MRKVLLATEKPFAKEAISKIKDVAHSHPDIQLELLEKYSSADHLLQAVKDTDALIVRSDQVTKEVLDAAENLQIIVRAGSGYDTIDTAHAKAREVVVMNTPGQNANAVAELAFGLMLTMIRNRFNGTSGTELKGKSIGLHGYGNIGKCTARIAKGFDMHVSAYDPYVTETINGVELMDSRDELYESSDFISLSMPANQDTIQSIDYSILSKAKANLVLVNTARKEIVEEAGLLQIMEERPGIRYCSDVTPNLLETFTSKFPDRVLFTEKKMGAQTGESNVNAGVAAIRQVIAYFETGNTTYQVN